MVKKRAIDFSQVKDGSAYSPAHVAEGDYLAKVIKVDEAESKSDGEPMWVFAIQLDERKSAVYPYYCKLTENQLWKLRNLLIAAGKNVPKKRVSVDPSSIVGSEIGITLEDDEYEGKMKSTIEAVFPASELEDFEPPAEKKSSKKSKKKREVEDDDEDDDLDELDLDEI